MNKLIGSLLVFFFGAIVLISLLTAANGVASAAASTALMTSQCLALIMVLIALAAGILFGANALAFLHNRKDRIAAQRNVHFFPSAPYPQSLYPQLPAASNWLTLPAPEEHDDEDDELAQALISLIKG